MAQPLAQGGDIGGIRRGDMTLTLTLPLTLALGLTLALTLTLTLTDGSRRRYWGDM